MYLGLFNPDFSTQAVQTSASKQSFWDKLPELIAAGLTVQNALTLQKINKQRLSAGLAPLSPSEYGVAPSARVDVGLDPQIKKYLLFGGLGLGAILLFTAFRK